MNPVFILHGALGSALQLDSVREALQRSGMNVYSMNFSGHGGETFQSEFGIEQFATDVLRELDKHKLSMVNVFGYSMGGYVALWLAHKHPHRIGKVSTLGTKFDWSVESASREVKKLNPEKIVEKIPAFARILESRHAPNDWKELMQKTADMMMSLGKDPLLTREILKSISHPTLICLGDQDDMADKQYSEEVAGLLRNGKFMLLDNTPHPIEKVSLEKLTDILLNYFKN
jgi:pimeloyl-ACP methyl ester carboxylesterase